MNCKLKSMMYRFKVRYIPGKDHVIPDTFSRRQDSPILQAGTSKQDLDGNISHVLPGYSDSLGPPSWVSTPSVAALTLADTTAEIKDVSEIEELLTGLILTAIADINHQSKLSPLT